MAATPAAATQRDARTRGPRASRRAVVEGAVIVVAGSLLHFTYAWSGDNPLVGLVSPVNESVWEHTKLIVVPVLAVGFVDAWLQRRGSVLCGALAGAVVGAALVPTLFYAYTGAFGVGAILGVDLVCFVASVAAAVTVKHRVSRLGSPLLPPPWLAGLAIAALLLLVAWATAAPPDLPLFESP